MVYNSCYNYPMPSYHHSIRLSPENYRGRRLYFVTICTHLRHPVFLDQTEGHWVLTHLVAAAARNNFSLRAFCVMPDHLHFLTEGTTDDSDLIRFANAFKQRTAFEYQKRCPNVLWQKRFHDYILRRADAIENVAAYIWMNPVRKNLFVNAKEYFLSGSQTIDWMRFAAAQA
jgi:REP element-mobilizing transposase RayT